MEEVNAHIDHKLLLACVRGEEASQYRLYSICYGPLYTVCQRYAQDEDEIGILLNTTFLKVIKGLKKYDYQNQLIFEAWIKRIAINTAIDAHRRNKKYKRTIFYPSPDEQTLMDGQVDYNKADQQFDAQQLLEMIRTLPPMTAKVFNLFAIDGFSHKEIGDMLAISQGTSKWHLSEARRRLQLLLRKSLQDETRITEPRNERTEKFFKI